MNIIFLGTSAAQPTKKRGMSCTCIITEGEILMFDAGEGAQLSCVRAGLGWNKKTTILITHMHGDHCIGILGLLQTMTLQKRAEPLEIYGPEGIEDFVASNMRVLKFGLTFPLKVRTITEGMVLDNPRYEIMTHAASHSIDALSYLYVEKDKPGRFSTVKAKELGIPEGKMWGTLQEGQNIKVNGRTVRPEDVLGPKRKGIKIGISGDTRPSKKLGIFFAGCDYLIFDSTFTKDMAERAEQTGHSTAEGAAKLAKDAGVKNLILTHFSARYADESAPLAEAQNIHGSVIAASDMLRVEIR